MNHMRRLEKRLSEAIKREERKEKKIKELEKKVLLAAKQNYCTICGKTLDSYNPKEREK